MLHPLLLSCILNPRLRDLLEEVPYGLKEEEASYCNENLIPQKIKVRENLVERNPED